MTLTFLRTRKAARIWVLAGLVLLTLNLRAAITEIPPVLDHLQATFHLSGTGLSVLTTLPVLCLGVFAAVTPAIARKAGTEATVTGAAFLITVGIVLRTVASPVALFAGTVLAGAGIAMGNVLMPVVIKQHFARRVGFYTGLAMTLMAVSGAIAAGLAVPLTDVAGWRVALAVWAIPSLAAVLVWGPLSLRARPAAARRVTRDTREPSLLRSPLAWAVSAFLGVVSLMFYVLVAWLPAIMQDQGFTAAEAGLMASAMLTIGIPLGFLVPVGAARMQDQRPLVVLVASVKAMGFSGILLAPQAGWVWITVLGIATGSAFPLAITLLSLRSPDPLVAARLSGMAQTIGYLLAGLGPLAMGTLHELTGDWNSPLLLTLGLAIPGTAFGLVAARPGFVSGITREERQPTPTLVGSGLRSQG
ncbi:MFS transporter [Streptomyces sp. NPDC000410]|uniref:CynX/NimT family MFS transporter n=1 Tax=Streptomyces sp. NPDC000410 TaxID=3154254 RepID=UPI00331E8F6F